MPYLTKTPSEPHGSRPILMTGVWRGGTCDHNAVLMLMLPRKRNLRYISPCTSPSTEAYAFCGSQDCDRHSRILTACICLSDHCMFDFDSIKERGYISNWNLFEIGSTSPFLISCTLNCRSPIDSWYTAWSDSCLPLLYNHFLAPSRVHVKASRVIAEHEADCTGEMACR